MKTKVPDLAIVFRTAAIVVQVFVSKSVFHFRSHLCRWTRLFCLVPSEGSGADAYFCERGQMRVVFWRLPANSTWTSEEGGGDFCRLISDFVDARGKYPL